MQARVGRMISSKNSQNLQSKKNLTQTWKKKHRKLSLSKETKLGINTDFLRTGFVRILSIFFKPNFQNIWKVIFLNLCSCGFFNFCRRKTESNKLKIRSVFKVTVLSWLSNFSSCKCGITCFTNWSVGTTIDLFFFCFFSVKTNSNN